MEEVLINDAVAQKDRISIDISDLREAIESCRNDAAWTELPMSAKIRVLVKERLEQMKNSTAEDEGTSLELKKANGYDSNDS